MEILKPRFGLGRFLNVVMTQIPFGFQDHINFKYSFREDACNTWLKRVPIIYGIKICAGNYSNKRGRMYNMIKQYLTVKNTPR